MIRNIKRKISHIYHRIKTGVSYNDTWGLGDYIDLVTYEGLKKFREVNNCYPASYSEEQWNKILDDMIEGFELIIQFKEMPFKNQPYIENYFYTKEEAKIIIKTRKLLEENRGGLWR